MKNNQICPKCGGKNILYVPGGAGVNGPHIKVGMTKTSVIPIDRFVCKACGYVESWIIEKEYLTLVDKRYGKHDKEYLYPWDKMEDE